MSSRKNSPRVVFVSLMLQQCLLGAAGAAWIAWQGLVTSAQLAVTIRNVALGLALAGALVGLALLAQRMFPVFMTRLNETVVTLWEKIGVRLTPTTVVLLALGAGIGEELLFRGALQGVLVPLLSPWGAVMAASLAFGIMHAASAAYFIAATVIGVVLGGAYYLSGSLVTVVVAHAAYDIWALNRLAGLLARRRERAA